MAYTVFVPGGRPGIVSYVLGGSEEFVVLAATWQVSTNSGNTPPYWFDYRDAQGGIIGIQCAGHADSGQPTLVSLVPNNPPAATIDASGIALFPSVPQQPNSVLVCPIMEPVPLEPGCTVNAYVAAPDQHGSTPDPMAYLDTGADPHDLHLWVEDTVRSSLPSVEDLFSQYALVPGPGF